MKLFQYAVIAEEKLDCNGKVKEKAMIVVYPDWVLAKDENHARVIAAREIPAEFDGRLDDLTIVVRPF